MPWWLRASGPGRDTGRAAPVRRGHLPAGSAVHLSIARTIRERTLGGPHFRSSMAGISGSGPAVVRLAAVVDSTSHHRRTGP